MAEDMEKDFFEFDTENQNKREEYIRFDNWKIPVKNLDKMSKKDLEHIHKRLQDKVTKILSDRSRFQLENRLPKNDNEYWKKMNDYRYALAKTQMQLHLVKSKIKALNVENSKKADKFCYMFFRTAQAQLPQEQFESLMQKTIDVLTITNIDYHIPETISNKN